MTDFCVHKYTQTSHATLSTFEREHKFESIYMYMIAINVHHLSVVLCCAIVWHSFEQYPCLCIVQCFTSQLTKTLRHQAAGGCHYVYMYTNCKPLNT